MAIINLRVPEEMKRRLADFAKAIEFVNKVAMLADKAGHHPDITINYNVVGINLSTHSESGITERDFELARQIDQIFSAAS